MWFSCEYLQWLSVLPFVWFGDVRMKVKLYVLTYANPLWLNKTLKSLYKSDFEGEVYIINNHSQFVLNKEYREKVSVLHNSLRLDRSTGHISRSWNQTIMNGFIDLKSPDCDVVVAVQDDTKFHKSWMSRMEELIGMGFTFGTDGWGDNFMFWTQEAVRQIGLWDERFIFGGCTSEYFLRALIYNKDKSFINDHYHDRLLNVSGYPKLYLAGRPLHKKEHWDERLLNRPIAHSMFAYKFPSMADKPHHHLGINWTIEDRENPPVGPSCHNFVLYPYFENDVLTLKQQRYLGYE